MLTRKAEPNQSSDALDCEAYGRRCEAVIVGWIFVLVGVCDVPECFAADAVQRRPLEMPVVRFVLPRRRLECW